MSEQILAHTFNGNVLSPSYKLPDLALALGWQWHLRERKFRDSDLQELHVGRFKPVDREISVKCKIGYSRCLAGWMAVKEKSVYCQGITVLISLSD